MPTLSDTMQSGHLLQWLKKPGDPVKKGEAIAEVESDKAVMDVEAFHDGYLAGPLAPEDSDQPVGAVIGYLVDDPAAARSGQAEPAETVVDAPPADSEKRPEAARPAASHEAPQTPSHARAEGAQGAPQAATEAVPPASPPKAPTQTTPAQTTSVASGDDGIKASPYARGLARELSIDLKQVPPGPDGTIRASQVIAAALQGPQPPLEEGPPYRIEPLHPMQRAVAEHMIATLGTPTFRVSARLSLAPLHRLAHDSGQSLSLLLARACALAVLAHPRFNAAYTPAGLAMRERVDVGIAVDVPNGLVTPVLRDVAGRPLDELAEDWRILKDKATGKVRSRRLAPEDYRGATFYLSNLGVFPQVTRFDAIVPQGASAILALGAEHDGQAEFTLSCDHRVVYGADAARFLGSLGEFLAAPETVVSNTPQDDPEEDQENGTKRN